MIPDDESFVFTPGTKGGLPGSIIYSLTDKTQRTRGVYGWLRMALFSGLCTIYGCLLIWHLVQLLVIRQSKCS